MPRGSVRPAPKCHPERRHVAFGMCSGCYRAKRRREASPELRAKFREWNEKWRLANLDRWNQAKLRLLTKKREERAGRPQAERCDVCDKQTKTYFDHSHKTGKFRGWLCPSCNKALGMVYDSPEILRKLADYLEQREN